MGCQGSHPAPSAMLVLTNNIYAYTICDMKSLNDIIITKTTKETSAKLGGWLARKKAKEAHAQAAADRADAIAIETAPIEPGPTTETTDVKKRKRKPYKARPDQPSILKEKERRKEKMRQKEEALRAEGEAIVEKLTGYMDEIERIAVENYNVADPAAWAEIKRLLALIYPYRTRFDSQLRSIAESMGPPPDYAIQESLTPGAANRIRAAKRYASNDIRGEIREYAISQLTVKEKTPRIIAQLHLNFMSDFRATLAPEDENYLLETERRIAANAKSATKRHKDRVRVSQQKLYKKSKVKRRIKKDVVRWMREGKFREYFLEIEKIAAENNNVADKEVWKSILELFRLIYLPRPRNTLKDLNAPLLKDHLDELTRLRGANLEKFRGRVSFFKPGNRKTSNNIRGHVYAYILSRLSVARPDYGLRISILWLNILEELELKTLYAAGYFQTVPPLGASERWKPPINLPFLERGRQSQL